MFYLRAVLHNRIVVVVGFLVQSTGFVKVVLFSCNGKPIDHEIHLYLYSSFMYSHFFNVSLSVLFSILSNFMRVDQ